MVPVTVIGSAVVASCLLPFEPVCANASGAISAKARVTIIFFIMPPSWMLMVRLVRQISETCRSMFSLPRADGNSNTRLPRASRFTKKIVGTRHCDFTTADRRQHIADQIKAATRLANETHVKPQSGHGNHRRTIEPAGPLSQRRWDGRPARRPRGSMRLNQAIFDVLLVMRHT